MLTNVSLSHRLRMIKHGERIERIADEKYLGKRKPPRLTEAQARALEDKLRKEGVIL